MSLLVTWSLVHLFTSPPHHKKSPTTVEPNIFYANFSVPGLMKNPVAERSPWSLSGAEVTIRSQPVAELNRSDRPGSVIPGRLIIKRTKGRHQKLMISKLHTYEPSQNSRHSVHPRRLWNLHYRIILNLDRFAFAKLFRFSDAERSGLE